MNTIIEIGPLQLVMCAVFVAVAGGASFAHKLGLGRDLAIGTVRTVAQLFLMGYVLKYVFTMNMAAPVLAMYLIMITAAVHIIRGRIKQKSIPFAMPVFVSMFISYSLVTYVVVGIIVGAKPWWTPQYFIPLAGMIVGNSMSAIAIALDRLFSDLRNRRLEVEMKLAHGATYREASQPIMREALKAGMIPSINSLMGVGLVSLPGMMTGQILAGADPLIAIRYQIIVMLMIVAATCIGSLLCVNLARARCFGRAGQLLLR